MKVDVSGTSPPQTLGESSAPIGSSTWSRDGVILIGGFGTGTIRRVSAEDGAVTEVTKVDPSRRETLHGLPIFLPDGRHFLYLRISADLDKQGIYVGSIEAKPEEQSTRRLLPSVFQVAYVPSPNSSTGRLIFLRESTLMSQPFDPARLELTGEPVPIAEQVGSFGAYGFFSASLNGALAFRGTALANVQLTWFDRQGKMTSIGQP